MLNYLKGLKIQGRKYVSLTEFDFWDKESSRISLLYGRNGSGKSTISDAFESLKNNESVDFTAITPIPFENNTFTEDDKKNIYVFNEKFVDRNIKINEDGIGAIVMFGRQAELDNQIQEKKVLYDQKLAEIEADTSICNDYLDKKNTISPDYYWRKCESELKAENGWAKQDSILKGLRQNSVVNSSTVKDIAENSTSEKSLEELIKEYNDKKRLFDSVTASSTKITSPIKELRISSIDENAKSILTQKIEKADFTEREQRIFDFVQQNGISLLGNAKNFFSKKNNTYCPYCFQEVRSDYKSSLIEEFKKILNQEAENYLTELKLIKQKPFTFPSEEYNQLDQSKVQAVTISLNALNNEVSKLNKLIEDRIDNIYQNFTLEDYNVNVDSAIKDFNENKKNLEQKRVEFNNLVDNKNLLKNELIEINKKIACKHIQADYQDYKQQLAAQKIATQTKLTHETEKSTIESEIKDLENQKKNIKIAQDHINKLLKYVFFDSDRLSIEPEENFYRIKSRGKPVKPNKISCGERNILALCYYFTELFSQKDETSVYTNPYLLIIDDPISSYDRENQIGVISLLKYELNNFMSSNADTKCLLMTHDLKTFFDLQRIAEELGKKTGCNFDLNELGDVGLSRFSFKKRNEYSEYLKNAYEYANGRNNAIGDYIGNLLRKIVEFYATFLYKLGIDEISLNKDVLGLIAKQEHRDYFENLMYRLVLHGESHLEERVRSLDEFCNGLTDTEKQRIARDVLCFLYLMNPLHVQKHLDGCSDVKETLSQWCNQIG